MASEGELAPRPRFFIASYDLQLSPPRHTPSLALRLAPRAPLILPPQLFVAKEERANTVPARAPAQRNPTQ